MTRQDNERRVVRGAIRALRAAGWQPVAVDDGGDTEETATTEETMLLHAFGVDEARCYFQHPDHATARRCWFFLVFGNADDGSEVIADYACPEGPRASFSETLGAYLDSIG